jgi:hypothetical protein
MEYATTLLGSSADLPKDQELESLTIDSVDDTRSIELSDYLTNNPSLRSLHVSFIEDCNAVTVLEGAMRHPRLQSLTVSNVYMDNDAAKTIQMLLHTMAHCENLRYRPRPTQLVLSISKIFFLG